MRLPAIVKRTVILAFLAIFALCRTHAEPKANTTDQDQALRTLRHYIALRLRDADWKEYSKFITWPDEPSWDCKWVASRHKVGTPSGNGQEVSIPVVYSRLGVFCYDFDFKPESRVVTLDYKLVKRPSGWKVNAPIPDYPDVGEDVLVKSLDATAGSASEPPERRGKAEATARKIKEAAKQETTTSPKPQTDL